MGFTVPPYWQHGDTPLYTDLQKYADNQNFFNGFLGTPVWIALQNLGGNRATFIHTWRWFHYKSTSGRTPTISATATEDSTTVPESVSEFAVYDLSDVEWLIEGAVYEISGFDYAAEDKDA